MVKATSDPQPAPKQQGGVTCYTCVNVSDNLMCNQYAIDSPCPAGEDFCHTLHIMDSTGASVIVNKKCADASECWPLGVGCVLVDTQTICVSCCDEMYCNVTVPTNQSNAIYTNRRTQHRTKVKSAHPSNSLPNQSTNSAASALCLLLVLLKSML
ncbi:hypothetical protein GE061_014073 [Apolygus lucorum]|uniref:UPAR/Ly6 domain-containing protein n=1 Tax=Apolygus lucorum TaxID=248454 RepID=A0A6A4JWM0_APOLU|nr:hypothetical protein GE061_014073 [Apolygus lucorum]